jgi:coenzyme F420-0:L-glutamate ligase/coenzyme F420-1:gamma-L-glutamate ligase
MPPSFTVTALTGMPLVQAGDDLPGLVLAALAEMGLSLMDGDVLVVTSKIVSKAEGRRVRLASVTPGDEAHYYAEVTGKDPRLVELVLRESRFVSRAAKGVLVTEHRLGFVSANAGIDQSNTEDGEQVALLLPENPDGTAQAMRAALRERAGVNVGVVLSDSHGRPFRLGNVGVALGVAGLPALLDLRGQADLFGRALQISTVGYADLVASAAALVTGEGSEGRPVVLVRGLDIPAGDGHASDLYRAADADLYR